MSDQNEVLAEHAQTSHRESEFPMLEGEAFEESTWLLANHWLSSAGTTYLDHAGTTLYPKSLIEDFSREMISNLLGNPHSTSISSQHSTHHIEDVRIRALRFFNASPDDFELIFVANATAGIKLVADGFRGNVDGFWYGYHKDAHTSTVGVREEATAGSYCFESDLEVEEWLKGSGTLCTQEKKTRLGLFSYPAQSNLNGRRLPLSWTERIRSSSWVNFQEMYSLLDAAALVSTSPIDLSNVSLAPDYTVLSFYKIFGFPDLGAVIVRKKSNRPLQRRMYFGGGTVDMVSCMKEQWHVKKKSSLHEQLEDGTLPIHSIIALGCALSAYERLYGSIERVSSHTSFLVKELYDRLSSIRHGNGRKACKIYKDPSSTYGDSQTQGPVIALSLRNSAGEWISNHAVEKLAFVKNIQFRSGGLCNPGGIASSLGLAPWEMKRNFSAGHRCGSDNDIIEGKPTGVIRLSLGAMSNLQDVTAFVRFIEEFFVQNQDNHTSQAAGGLSSFPNTFYIEKLTIYPIKSCGGWSIPITVRWDVRAEGLAWDREWCLVHEGTRAALSQKRYPKMALFKPSIDLPRGLLHIRYDDPCPSSSASEITVPLSAEPSQFENTDGGATSSKVCEDTIKTQIYASKDIAAFFTIAMKTRCTLARFPPRVSGTPTRYTAARRQPHQTSAFPIKNHSMPGAFPADVADPITSRTPIAQPILFANESPILTISRSSVNRLNEEIKVAPTGIAIHASAFRANIILAEDPSTPPGTEQPYAEELWSYMDVISSRNRAQSTSTAEAPTRTTFELLGACRRCQMVCVDQHTGERGEEPMVTLAKTRRFDGKVFFGVHTALSLPSGGATIAVGDQVMPVMDGEKVLQ